MPNWNRINNELSEAVLASGRLDELLSALGSDVKGLSCGTRFRGPCPVHLGADSNFVVGTNGDLFPIFWACHSRNCHKTGKLMGNLLGLVRGARTQNPDRPAPVPEAVTFIEDFLARGGDSPTAVRRSPVRPTRATQSWTREQVRQRLVIPSPYFLSRGFSRAVLDRFDIGESRKLDRATIPIYDDPGRTCVGAITRSTSTSCSLCNKCHDVTDPCGRGESRWSFLPGFPKGDYLFNFAAGRSRAPFVLLVEGVPDVLRAAEAGIVAMCGFGTGLSEQQVVKLTMLNKKVVVAFDNDDAGREAGRNLMPALHEAGLRAVLKSPPSRFKDVGEMPAETVATWLAA